jgi:hypothetical protein
MRPYHSFLIKRKQMKTKFLMLVFMLFSMNLLNAQLVGQFTFEKGSLKDTKRNFGDLRLKGKAKIKDGKLKVGANAYAVATPYRGSVLKEKTLVAWVRIDNKAMRGGSVLSLARTVHDFGFDGIVYAERQPETWMAGSDYFRRTRDIGNPAKETTPGQFVKMAISYKNDNGKAAIKIYRNGILVGQYTQNTPLIDFSGSNLAVLLGARHFLSGGRVPNAFVDATIEEVRIYGNVLDAAAIKALTLGSNNSLLAGQELKTGEQLTSKNGVYYLRMQSDGNLCLKKTANDGFVWCSMAHGFQGGLLKMQSDGNLAVYNGSKQMKWSSKTLPSDDQRFNNTANKPVKAVLENDGTLKLYNASGDAVWSNKKGTLISNKKNSNSRAYLSSTSKTNLDALLNANGGASKYSTHYVDALTTMIAVEDLIKVNNYQQAKKELDALWKTYPIGDEKWRFSNADDKKFKTNIGSPAAYAPLRMLTDIVNHHLNNPTPPNEVATVTLRVVLVGCSEGNQPRTVSEMKSSGGQVIKRTIDSRLKANNHRIINQSLYLYLQYVNAMSDGKLNVQVKYYDLDYCVPTKVSKDGTKANFKNNSDVINQIPNNIKEESDWFWIIYPSVVPEDGQNGVTVDAGFDKFSFNTGGMDTRRGKPHFIVNDKWLLRVPPHMGKGKISDIERRAYMPQWLQHEFFHYLYTSYPKLLLEQKYNSKGDLVKDSHKWFDKNKWPSNFVGTFEADYFQESLHKKLKQAKPILWVMLHPTYKPSAKILNSLKMEQFLTKTFDASEAVRKRNLSPNDYHIGQIIQENGKYYWKNKANVQWEVQPDFKNGEFKNLSTKNYPGENFSIIFKKDNTGAFTNQIEGLFFNGVFYKMK